jgi:hypothetical protein
MKVTIIYIIPIVTKDGNAEQQTPKVNLDQDIQGLRIILYQKTQMNY